jgi:hypothetical protein
MKLFSTFIYLFIACILLIPHAAPVFAQAAPGTPVATPNFNTLAPCPSCTTPSEPVLTGAVTPSTGTPGTNPGLTQTPCDSSISMASDTASHSKHKKHHGAISNFMQQILQFFLKLINMLLQLLGGGSINMPSSSEPAISAIPSAEQPASPSQEVASPSQAVEVPSVAPMTNPCPSPGQTNPGTGGSTPQTSTAPAISGGVPGTSMAPSTSTAPSAGGPSGTPGQKLGVCGVPAPAAGPNAVLTTTDSAAPLSITTGGTAGSPKIYDGGCHTVGTITIRANYVTVQNFKVVASGQYGIDSDATGVTIQNNDIKGVHASGDGDLNAITFFGNDTKILYNTAIDFVTGSPGTSHTDGIQTWVSTSHPTASTNVTIQGNTFTGPANPSRDNNIPSIHQCVMAEGLNQGGNTGGSGNPSNWLIADNTFGDSWNQCIKLDGVTNASITRNTFAGSSDTVIEVAPASTGIKYFSDNKVTGQYKNGVGTTITQGAGPTTLGQ